MTALTLVTLSGLVLVALTLSACAGHDAVSKREVDLIALHLRLAGGATAADIGAGTGGYAIALAARVGPDGRVLATELTAGKVAEIARRARTAGQDNVRAIQAEPARTGLPPGCCDGVFMRGVYHHLTDPAPTLADIYRALRPGGRFLVIDFPPTWWLRPWTPKNLPDDRHGHGIEPGTVEREAQAAGFVVESRQGDWPGGPFHDLYALVFEKPEAAGIR